MELLDFTTDHWSKEIGDVTESPEFQTCTVQIVDPTQIEVDYNVDTGETTETGDGKIYEGRARLIAVRRGVNFEGSNQGNSKVITAIRVQIPRGELPIRVKKGTVARVLSAPMNPTLETYVFYMSSDVHGSSAASRTFEFNLDGDTTHG